MAMQSYRGWYYNNNVRPGEKAITARIAGIEQDYQDVILSSSQYYVNQNFCLHIVTVMGIAHRLTELSDKLTAIKGIKHGKLVMSRAD